jgi:predicted dehydrogenase
VDVLHWFTGEALPSAAVAAGGIFFYKDGRTAPDTIHTALDYPGGYTATFDAALAAPEGGNGAEFLFTNGRLVFGRTETTLYPIGKDEAPIVRKYSDDHAATHVANFVECMRTRRTPNADVRIGHRSAVAAHLCNLAYRRQQRVLFDPAMEEIVT